MWRVIGGLLRVETAVAAVAINAAPNDNALLHKKQLSAVGKLLPWTQPSQVLNDRRVVLGSNLDGGSATTLDAYGGCFHWRSSRPDVIEIGNVDTEGHPMDWSYPRGPNLQSTEPDGCTPRVALYTSQIQEMADDERERAVVTAVDVISGSELRAEVHVTKIRRIELETSMRSINVGATEALQVRAYDSQGNVFSSLEGVRFTWAVTNQKILRSLALDSYVYRTSPIRRSLQDHNEQADVHLVQGMHAGVTTVTVTLQEPGYPPIATTVEVKVKEPVEILPGKVVVAPGASFEVDLVKHSTNGSPNPVKLPDPNYTWSSSHEDSFSVTTSGRICIKETVVERIDGRVSAVDNRGTSDDAATIIISQPARLSLNLIKHTPGSPASPATSYLVEGQSYVVEPLVFDEKNTVMKITDNALFEYDCIGVASTTKQDQSTSSSIQRRCGISEVKLDTQGRRIVKAVAVGDVDIFLSWTGHAADSANCPLAAGHTFDAPVRGNSRLHVVRPLSLLGFDSVAPSVSKAPSRYHSSSSPSSVSTHSIPVTNRPIVMPSGHSIPLAVDGGSGYYLWESSDESVAAVSNQGVISAQKRRHSTSASSVWITVRDQYNADNAIRVQVLVGSLSKLSVNIPVEELRVRHSARFTVRATMSITAEQLTLLDYPEEMKRKPNFLEFSVCDRLHSVNLRDGDINLKAALSSSVTGVEGILGAVSPVSDLLPGDCYAQMFTPSSVGDGTLFVMLDEARVSQPPHSWPIHEYGVVGSLPFSVVEVVVAEFPPLFLNDQLKGLRPQERCSASASPPAGLVSANVSSSAQWPLCQHEVGPALRDVERVVAVGESVQVLFSGGPEHKPASAGSLRAKHASDESAIKIESLKTTTLFDALPTHSLSQRLYKITCLEERAAVPLTFRISWGSDLNADTSETAIACSRPRALEIAPLPSFHVSDNEERRLGLVTPRVDHSGHLFVTCGMVHELGLFAWDAYGREIDIFTQKNKVAWELPKPFTLAKSERGSVHQDRLVKFHGAVSSCDPLATASVSAVLSSSQRSFALLPSAAGPVNLSDSVSLSPVPDVALVFAGGHGEEGNYRQLSKLIYTHGIGYRVRTVFGSGAPLFAMKPSPAARAWNVLQIASSPPSDSIATDLRITNKPSEMSHNDRSSLERAYLAQISSLIPLYDERSHGTPRDIVDTLLLGSGDHDSALYRSLKSQSTPLLMSSSEWVVKPLRDGHSDLYVFDPFVNGHKVEKLSFMFERITSLAVNWLRDSSFDPTFPASGSSLISSTRHLVAHAEINRDHFVEVLALDQRGLPFSSHLTSQLNMQLRPTQQKSDSLASSLAITKLPPPTSSRCIYSISHDRLATFSLGAIMAESSAVDLQSNPIEVQFYQPLTLLPGALVIPPQRAIDIVALGGPSNARWSAVSDSKFVINRLSSGDSSQSSSSSNLWVLDRNAKIVASVKALAPGSSTIKVKLDKVPFPNQSASAAATTPFHFVSGELTAVTLPVTVADPTSLTLESTRISRVTKKLEIIPHRPAFVRAIPLDSSGHQFTPGSVSVNDSIKGGGSCTYHWSLSGPGSDQFAIVPYDVYHSDVIPVGHYWALTNQLKDAKSSKKLDCTSCESIAVVTTNYHLNWDDFTRQYPNSSIQLKASIRCQQNSSGWGIATSNTITTSVPIRVQSSAIAESMPAIYSHGARPNLETVYNDGIFMIPNGIYSIPLSNHAKSCDTHSVRVTTHKVHSDTPDHPAYQNDQCLTASVLEDCSLTVTMGPNVGCTTSVHVHNYTNSGHSSHFLITSAYPQHMRLVPESDELSVLFGSQLEVPITLYDSQNRAVLIPSNLPSVALPLQSSLFKGSRAFPKVVLDGSGTALLKFTAPEMNSLEVKPESKRSTMHGTDKESELDAYCTSITVSFATQASASDESVLIKPWGDNVNKADLTTDIFHDVVFDTLSFCLNQKSATLEAPIVKFEDSDTVTYIPSTKVYERILFAIVVALLVAVCLYAAIAVVSSTALVGGRREIQGQMVSGGPPGWSDPVVLPSIVRSNPAFSGRIPSASGGGGTPPMSTMSSAQSTGVIGGLNDPYECLRRRN
eukprot:GHVH01003457.1.p1 GENE.GHVH01003457.1~~GHVH01003457.1.p1  ORF type:complete len:2074 (-),score=269.05 GHVH01003457.1:99-6320(-)